MNTPSPNVSETATAVLAEQVRVQQLRDSHLRSVIKAVSWRVIGTIDTMVISYFWTGNMSKAIVIGSSEVLTKVCLYYFHERFWTRIPLGTVRRLSPFAKEETPPAEPASPLSDSNFRSILKAISWRIVGTLDTILVSYFWTGNMGKALVIGSTDVVTKIGLYYFHERAWVRIPLGTIRQMFRQAGSAPEKPR